MKNKTLLNEITSIGMADASIVLYLQNPPTLYDGFNHRRPDVARLIEENGNHWRKILTIFAKLCGGDDWRSYRDNALLSEQMISFDNRWVEGAKWHIVGGKANWQWMGLDPGQFECLDYDDKGEGRLYRKDNVLLVPYPDYRQLPNVLITRIKSLGVGF